MGAGHLWIDELCRLDPSLEVRSLEGDESLSPEAIHDITYAVVWRPPHGLLASLPHLKAVFSLGAGVDSIMADPSLPDIPVVRSVSPDLTARMSEYVVLQTLYHHRRMTDYSALKSLAKWRYLHQPAASEVRVGVLGLGVLGMDAARKLSMLGFQVAGWSRTPKSEPDIDCFTGDDEFPSFLARTDILICLLPLTEATRGILNKDTFSRLPQDGAGRGPVIINAARGGHQVEADILAALNDGILSGVSLDVFEEEPLPETSPLWQHERAVITPHVASISDPKSICRIIIDNIRRSESGHPLENVVDRTQGY